MVQTGPGPLSPGPSSSPQTLHCVCSATTRCEVSLQQQWEREHLDLLRHAWQVHSQLQVSGSQQLHSSKDGAKRNICRQVGAEKLLQEQLTTRPSLVVCFLSYFSLDCDQIN